MAVLGKNPAKFLYLACPSFHPDPSCRMPVFSSHPHHHHVWTSIKRSVSIETQNLSCFHNESTTFIHHHSCRRLQYNPIRESKKNLTPHIFCSRPSLPYFTKKSQGYRKSKKRSLNYYFHETTFPNRRLFTFENIFLCVRSSTQKNHKQLRFVQVITTLFIYLHIQCNQH